jgi:hypothetical protein
MKKNLKAAIQLVRQHLNRYALAKALVGVGLIVLAWPAEANVVSTPVNVTLSGNGSIKIDLNQDGITDFVLRSVTQEAYCGTVGGGQTGTTRIIPTTGDGIVVFHLNFVALLASGISVDASSTLYNARTIVTQLTTCKSRIEHASGFLGLEFQINGQTHYGWAQVDITVYSGFRHGMRTTLIGFAYETIPGQAIRTGQTAGNFSETGPTPASMNPIDLGIGSQLVTQNPTLDDVSETEVLGLNKDRRDHKSANSPIALNVFDAVDGAYLHRKERR